MLLGQLVNESQVCSLFTSFLGLHLIQLNLAAVQLVFWNFNSMGFSRVADQFDPVAVIILVQDGLDHTARIVDRDLFFKVAQVRVSQGKGQ